MSLLPLKVTKRLHSSDKTSSYRQFVLFLTRFHDFCRFLWEIYIFERTSHKQGRWRLLWSSQLHSQSVIYQLLIYHTLVAYCWPQEAKQTRNGEAVNIFVCTTPHCITGSLAPLRLDYLPAKQKQAGCLLWAVSCGDKIRWEIFRPLSSPLNSVVSFSSAPHQKGNVAMQNKRKREK